jgi:hypothetical protein
MSLILILLHLTGLNRILRVVPLEFLGISSTESYDPEEIPSITIVNNTGYEIVQVFIKPSDRGDWGNDWLPSDQVLRNNQYETFTMAYPLGVYRRYDIGLIDSDGDSYSKAGITITQQRRIVFTFSDID